MSWRKALAAAIGIPDLALGSATDVPFAVRGESPITWQPPVVREIGNDTLELEVVSPEGLVALWRLRRFVDTRAVEISGAIRNAGAKPVRRLREVWTLDAPFQLSEGWGEPRVRTFGGVHFFPGHFPPDDFRYTDRQMLRTPQVYTPIGGRAMHDGRSSGQDIPALVMAGAAGDRGIGLFYEWSGLWSMGVTQAASTAAAKWPWTVTAEAGIWGLQLDLPPGGELPLPNLLMLGFEGDLRAGSNAIRRHIARHIMPTLDGVRPPPPTSFNHYFAIGNDFTASSLMPAVKASAECGLEYFVVDGGWFSNGFRHGIGNWSAPDPRKFPDGIEPFADYVRSQGIKFGIWFEPEFAHVTSEIYTQHPDWFLTGPRSSPWNTPTDVHYPDGVRMTDVFDLGENFALMDFGNEEVRRYWVDRITDAYHRWGVRWIRWDFNQPPRPYWEHNEREGAIGWNQIGHITGLYRVLDDITAACPDLLIEQCASGGYRIDLGTIRRGHTFWMNDHTTHSDIVRALQQNLNEILPGGYANTNLCQPRFDFDEYDFLSHGGGAFGLSSQLWDAPPNDLARIKDFVARYKRYRHLLNADYDRQSGQPHDRADAVDVRWSDGSEGLRMQFNGSGPRSAVLTHSAVDRP